MSSETPEAVKQWLGMCERIVSLWERQQQESRDGQAKYRREAFVMAAMQGLCANDTYDDHVSMSEVARIAIEQADATLLAMEQSDKEGV